MRSDDVSVDGEAEYSEAFLEIVLPNRSVPLVRATLEKFSAPNVIYKYVDVAMGPSNVFGKNPYLVGIEMVDGDREACATEAGNEFCSLFDCLRTVVVRSL
jgi:hypothetical protein